VLNLEIEKINLKFTRIPVGRMTVEQMLHTLQEKGRPLADFKKGDTVRVNNKMRKGYSYRLDENPGENFAAEFKPYLTPGEMLSLGVFEGKYLNDCLTEFPAEWFLGAIALDKLRPEGADVSINYFGVGSRQPLNAWRKAGWVPGGGKDKRFGILSSPSKNPDERGWFQWYCRYWMGRRMPELDQVQIGRWKAFTRHAGQIKANCTPRDLNCRPVQRQALLQWSHNPFI
jgi:hypothetical protein